MRGLVKVFYYVERRNTKPNYGKTFICGLPVGLKFLTGAILRQQLQHSQKFDAQFIGHYCMSGLTCARKSFDGVLVVPQGSDLSFERNLKENLNFTATV